MSRSAFFFALGAIAFAAYGPVAPALATPATSRPASRLAQSVAPASHDHATNADSDDDDDDHASGSPAPSTAPSHATPHCRHQQPLPFLVRSHYLHQHGEFAQSLRYRTEHYGYFPGFGEAAWNAHAPRTYAERTTFMGLPVTLNRRIIPALQCAEAEIRRTCSAHPYRPRSLAGIRFRNTYRGGEITNHAYGIAIDVDPDRNTCCHCVGHWAEAPLCRRVTHTIWERMAMPECWVTAFEQFGFYWLGHDALQDTMHFEFLADPDRIVRGH